MTTPIIGNNVVLCLPLNESSGSIAYDCSGNGNDAICTGTTIVKTSLNGSRARKFNGVDDKVDIVSFPRSLSGDYTFYFSCYLDATGANGNVIGWSDRTTGGTDYLSLNFVNTGTLFQFQVDGAAVSQITTPMTISTWTRFAATYVSSTGAMELFKNGGSVGTAIQTTGLTNADFYIGQLPWSVANINTWLGKIKGVGVLNEISSPEEIKQDYKDNYFI